MQRMHLPIAVLSLLCTIPLSAGADDFDLDEAQFQGQTVTGTNQADNVIMSEAGSFVTSINTKGESDVVQLSEGLVTGDGVAKAIELGDDADTLIISGGATIGQSGGSGIIDAGAGDDTLQFLTTGALTGAANGNLFGSGGNDVFSISGTTIVGGTLFGDDDDTVAEYDATNDGNDTINVSGTAEVDLVRTAGGADTINFNGNSALGANADGGIYAGDGDDIITLGSDITLGSATTVVTAIDGGAGDDQLTIATENLTDAAATNRLRQLLGGTGEDTLTLETTDGSTSTLLGAGDGGLVKGFEHIVFTGTGPTGTGSWQIDSPIQDDDGNASIQTLSLSLAPSITDDTYLPGTLTISEALTVTDATTIADGALLNTTLAFTTQTLTISEGQINADAALTVTGSTRLADTNTKLVANTTFTGGTLAVTGGDFDVTGVANVTGLTTLGGGTIDAANTFDTGSLSVSSGTFTPNNTLTINEVAGTSGATGNLTISGGTLDAQATANVAAAGHFAMSGGVANFAGAANTITKTTSIRGGTVNFTGAASTLTDTATFSDGIVNVGAGATLNTSAALTLGRDPNSSISTSNAALNVDAAGTLAPAANLNVLSYGQLDLNSNMNVGGDLSMNSGEIDIDAAATMTVTGTASFVGGDVSGTGALQAASAGFSGGETTTINAAITTTGDMAIQDGATLDTDNNVVVGGDLTIDGDGSQLKITGGKNLTVTNLLITNGGSTAGNFTIAGGTTTAQSGSVIQGTATFLDFNSLGGVTFNAGNSIGDQTFNGATTWNNDNIVVEFDAATSDRYIASGAGVVTVTGGSNILPTPDTGYLHQGTTDYQFLIEQGGGSFVNPNLLVIPQSVLDSSAILAYSLETDLFANDTLRVTRNTYASVADTANQTIVADVLDGSVAAAAAGGGDPAVVLGAVDAANGVAGVRAAYNQLSAEPYANLTAINFQVGNMFIDQQLNRITQAAENQICPDPCSMPNGFGAAMPTGMTSPFWIQNLGGWQQQDSRGGALGYNSSLYGAIVGYQQEISSLVFGSTFGFASQRVNFDGSDAQNYADYFNTGLYGGWMSCGSFIVAGANYVYAANHMHRPLTFGGLDRVADGDAFDNMSLFFATAGKSFAIPHGVLIPTIGVRGGHAGIRSLTENGANSANLTIEHMWRNSLILETGGRLVFDHRGIRTELIGVWMHEMSDDDDRVTAQMGFGSAYTLAGIQNERDAFRLGTRLSSTIWGVDTFVRYDGVVASGYGSHTGSIGINVLF